MPTKSIQMRLSIDTLSKVDDIKTNTGIENRTRIVTSGITLLDSVCSEIKKGNKVYIEDSCGNKKEILLLNL